MCEWCTPGSSGMSFSRTSYGDWPEPAPAATADARTSGTVRGRHRRGSRRGGGTAERGVRLVREAGPVQALPPAAGAATGRAPAMSGVPGGGGGAGGGGGRGGWSGGVRPWSGDIGRLPGPLLRYHAQRHPQAVPALPYDASAVTGTAGCTFAELDRRARAVAARLGSQLQPGSRVMLVYPQGPDLAGAFFGCLYAGMAAIPVVLDARGPVGAVPRAVARCAPDLVLTGADAWSPLAIDRNRTSVTEADGVRVGGEPVWRLAQTWQPVGVMRTAPAYHRYHDDGAAGGRLEPAMGHSDLSDVMGELAQAVRLGTDEENVGWIAAVHGVEDAIWRILLPVRVTA